MMRLGRRYGAGLFVLATVLTPVVWANDTQEEVTYYDVPPFTNLNPFHVRRLTVGVGYLGVADPPLDSAIFQGPVGIGVQNPVLPLEIAPLAANAAVRWLGTGANRAFLIENSVGNMRVVPDDGSASPPPRLFITNEGSLGVGTSIAPAVSLVQIGTLGDTVNASVRWLGNAKPGGGNYPSFYLENDQGNFRFMTDDGAGGVFSQKLSMASGGNMGVMMDVLPDAPMPLEIGTGVPESTNSAVQWVDAAGATRYFYLENQAGDLVLAMKNSAGILATERMRVTGNGSVGIGTSIPSAKLHVTAQNALGDPFQAHANFGAVPIGTTVPGSGNLGIGTTVPRSAIHIKGSTGFLAEGPPQSGEPADLIPYACQVSVLAFGQELRIGKESANGNVALPPSIAISRTGATMRVGINKSNPQYPFDVGVAPWPAAQIGSSAVFGPAPDPSFPEPAMVVNATTTGLYKRILDVPTGKYHYFRASYTDSPLGSKTNYAVRGTHDVKDAVTVNGTGYVSGGRFDLVSSIAGKTDVQPLSLAEEQLLLGKLLQLPLYYFQIKKQSGLKNRRLGVLSEEAPRELVDEDRRTIVYGDYLATLLAAIKAQRAEIESLTMELDRLEKEQGEGGPS